jgi:antitoxin HicB
LETAQTSGLSLLLGRLAVSADSRALNVAYQPSLLQFTNWRADPGDGPRADQPGCSILDVSLTCIGVPAMQYKVPLILTPQPEGGYTVTSPLLPELVTEGDTVDEALSNVKDALAAVIEAYEDLGRTLPQNTQVLDSAGPVWLETLVTAP